MTEGRVRVDRRVLDRSSLVMGLRQGDMVSYREHETLWHARVMVAHHDGTYTVRPMARASGTAMVNVWGPRVRLSPNALTLIATGKLWRGGVDLGRYGRRSTQPES